MYIIGIVIVITVVVVWLFSGNNKNTPWQTPEDDSTMNDPG